MRILCLIFCAFCVSQIVSAQSEVPPRIATNNVGKMKTKGEILFEKANQAFENQDDEAAFKYYLQSAKAGYIDAYVKVGDCYEQGWGVEINNEKALEWYKKSAYASVALGQYLLGRAYFLGLLGLEVDKQKGIEWLWKAESGLSEDAAAFLADCFIEGNGVEQNIEEGVRLLKEAAEWGNEYAQKELARRYEIGLGVEKDLEKAKYWRSKITE